MFSARLLGRLLPFTILSLATALSACAHKTPAPVAPATPVENAVAATKDQSAVVPIDPDDPVWGNPTALVTVVEFADFECVFCKRVEPTIQQLKKTYGPEQLRIVWKHFPLAMHPHARPASQAASAVFAVGGSDAFWKFHDAVMPEKKLGDTFDAEAQAAGVDLAQFHARLASGFPLAKVAHDAALGEKLGVDGTPAFFINGAFVSGALPVEVFQEAIDETIKQAKEVLAKGTAKDDLYVTVSKINFTPPGSTSDQPNEPPEDTTSVWKVPIGNSPVLGPASAPVTLVFFSDFQCPFCAQADATLKIIEKEYAGKLRVVWKNYPLSIHPRAEPAAELAFEARAEKGNAGFWDAHDRLFASQIDLGDESLGQIAGEMGLDQAKVKRAIEQHTHKSEIQADLRLAAEVDADGAPQTFINGRRLVGAQPAGAFRALIQAELDHAAAMVKSGTPAASVYDAIVAEGKVAAKPEQKTIELPAPTKLPVRGPGQREGVDRRVRRLRVRLLHPRRADGAQPRRRARGQRAAGVDQPAARDAPARGDGGPRGDRGVPAERQRRLLAAARHVLRARRREGRSGPRRARRLRERRPPRRREGADRDRRRRQDAVDPARDPPARREGRRRRRLQRHADVRDRRTGRQEGRRR